MTRRKVSPSGANSLHLNPVPEEQEISLVYIKLTDDFQFRLLDDDKTIEDYRGIYRQHLNDRENDPEATCPLGAIHVLRVKD